MTSVNVIFILQIYIKFKLNKNVEDKNLSSTKKHSL